MIKELEEMLDELLGVIEPEPLIKAEINYKPVMLGVKCGTNKRMVKLFAKSFGITEQQIDDLIKKYLNEALINLLAELSDLMVKGIEVKYPDAEVTKEVFEKKILEDE